ncbi:MAG: type II toxin-antitoxin system Phd/YefM family antitoxin [Terriglobales bacterium]
METVNIARLRNGLCAYIAKVRRGEEIVIRDRNLPVAKLVPIDTSDLSEEDLDLVASGQMRLPSKRFDLDEFLRLPGGNATLEDAVAAALAEREDDR